jgi:potassium channel subfamily K member 5
VPITQTGKIFTIAYALIGIALAGIVLTATSGYLSGRLLRLYKRQLKERNEKMAIVVAALAFLVPGLLLFVFIPAFIFCSIEKWSYLDGVYFSVVTLTTIGFGDIVPGKHGWFYRLAIINWIIIGASYFAVMISFVSKAISVICIYKILKLIFSIKLTINDKWSF